MLTQAARWQGDREAALLSSGDTVRVVSSSGSRQGAAKVGSESQPCSGKEGRHSVTEEELIG